MDSPEPLFIRNVELFDGTSYTGSGMSVLLRAGRIEAVGKDTDLHSAAREASARQIDLAGAFLMPGITDAHIHTIMLGEMMLMVDLFDCKSPAECVNLVAARAAQTPKGQWVHAGKWRKSIWDVDAFPTADMIDEKVREHPVLCSSFDGHSIWVNSAAMKLAGIGAATEDPPGGEIQRDASGNPTGVFKERAEALITEALPKPSEQARRESLLRAQKHLNRLGITGVHNMDAFEDYVLAGEMAGRSDLTIRFGACCRPGQEQQGGQARAGGKPADLVHLLGVKMFADGSLNSQTAAMFEPFAGGDSRGILTLESEELRANVARAAEHRLGVFVHAIGDRAVAEVLDAVEAVGDPSLPNRIEHAAVIRKRDVARMQRMGVAGSVQPCHIVTDITACDKYIGRRCRRAYVFREMLDAGVNLAFGSDAPVVSADPRENIFAAVARQDLEGNPQGGWYPQQRLTAAEVLCGMSRGPAVSVGAGGVLGTVSPGFEADLTVFGGNPLAAAPVNLLKMPILMTIVNGHIVNDAT